MHPRFIPTVEQFRPFRHYPATDYRSNGAEARGHLALIAGTDGQIARERPPARGRLRPRVEFRA
jgi:hypothetical protein